MKPLPPINPGLDNTSQKTESINSDDPAPPSSGIFSATPTFKFDLESSFPAIRAPIELLRRIPESQDINALRSLAPIFSRCLSAILDSMTQLPEGVRSSPAFQMAEGGVLYSNTVFMSHVEQLSADEAQVKGNRVEEISLILQLLDITLSSLKEFLQVAGHELQKTKPLPESPTLDEYADELIDDFTEDNGASAPNDVSSAGSEAEFGGKPRLALKNRRSKLSALLKPLSIRGKRKKSKTPQPTSGDSSSTLVAIDTEPEPCVREYDHASTNIRNSIAKLDIFVPQVEDFMPHPADFAELYFNLEGALEGGTLRGLVHFLTSRDPTSDFTFLDVFFLTFRCFTTPIELFQALVARYDEMPDGLATDHGATEPRHIKMRVAKIIHLWVDFHWRQALDADVFGPLLQFAFRCLARDLPKDISSKIVTTLHNCACAEGEYRSRRLTQRNDAATTNHHASEPLTWTPSAEDLMRVGDFSQVSILSFNSPEGRKYFAQQLSLCFWETYSKFDPEDAVKYWHDRKNKVVASKISSLVQLEQAVSLWTTQCILAGDTTEVRVEIAQCLIDIAKESITDRNYAGGFCLLDGINRMSIRLSCTFASLSPEHSGTLDDLNRFFDNRNRDRYKAALEATCRPAIPITSAFIHEVIVACESFPQRIEHPEAPGLNLINIKRYRTITETVRRMEKCHFPYQHERVGHMQDWLGHTLAPLFTDQCEAEDKFIAQSKVIEPRGAKRPSPSRSRSWQCKLEKWASAALIGMDPELLQIPTC
ncbi:ras GEF [Leucogyrophana mollusca]|uniref:Ras GEF n=1 Tax=Leucogyrophana mollusca TaxID=85980 RepID=A0ACB8BDF1_9AGAM|nr:ras GEF [Leucogyrophana mollusca]